MAKYTVTVTPGEDAALAKVAAADGKTVQELVEEQMRYYLGCVLRDYLDRPEGELTADQRTALDARLVLARNDFITQVKSASAR